MTFDPKKAPQCVGVSGCFCLLLIPLRGRCSQFHEYSSRESRWFAEMCFNLQASDLWQDANENFDWILLACVACLLFVTRLSIISRKQVTFSLVNFWLLDPSTFDPRSRLLFLWYFLTTWSSTIRGKLLPNGQTRQIHSYLQFYFSALCPRCSFHRTL